MTGPQFHRAGETVVKSQIVHDLIIHVKEFEFNPYGDH